MTRGMTQYEREEQLTALEGLMIISSMTKTVYNRGLFDRVPLNSRGTAGGTKREKSSQNYLKATVERNSQRDMIKEPEAEKHD